MSFGDIVLCNNTFIFSVVLDRKSIHSDISGFACYKRHIKHFAYYQMYSIYFSFKIRVRSQGIREGEKRLCTTLRRTNWGQINEKRNDYSGWNIVQWHQFQKLQEFYLFNRKKKKHRCNDESLPDFQFHRISDFSTRSRYKNFNIWLYHNEKQLDKEKQRKKEKNEDPVLKESFRYWYKLVYGSISWMNRWWWEMWLESK